MARHNVCRISDLGPGESLKIEIEGRDIALYNVDGKFYATDDFCRHRGGHLGEGHLEGSIVVCPDHGWRYDVTSGRCLSHPKGDVTGYVLTLSGDMLEIEIPPEP